MFFAYIIVIFLTIFIISYTSYHLYIQSIPGAPFYPTTQNDIKTIFKFLKFKPNDTFIDLGSGDGRIIISAAQHGLKSIGYELNPFLIRRSQEQIKKLKLSKLAKIEPKNFWKANFNQADIICIYQYPKYNKKLELIFKKINHPITVIINDYPFPNKKPYLIKGKIYFYKFP